MKAKLTFVVLCSAIAVGVLLWIVGSEPIDRVPDPVSVSSHLPTLQETVPRGDSAPSEPSQAASSPAAGTLPGADSVFEDVDPRKLDQNALDEFLNARPAVRFRAVTIDTDFLRAMIRDDSVDRTTVMHLFDDVVLKVDTLQGREYVDGQFSGHATWIARVSADPTNTVNIMIDPAGLVDASFRSSDGVYKIESLGESEYHIIWQQDTNISIDLH